MKVIIAIAIFLFVFGGGCGACGSCGSGSSSGCGSSSNGGCGGCGSCVSCTTCSSCGNNRYEDPYYEKKTCDACDAQKKEAKKYAKFFKKHGMYIEVLNYNDVKTTGNILFKKYDEATIYVTVAPYFEEMNLSTKFSPGTRNGFIYKGVNEKKDGTGTWYIEADGSWSKNAKGDYNIETAHDKDVSSLYAYHVWQPIEYTLTLEMNTEKPIELQGTFQPITVNGVTVGKSLKQINSINFGSGLPNLIPVDPYLYFKGWKTPDGTIHSAGTDFVLSSSHIPSDNSLIIKLEAVFEARKTTLTYYYGRDYTSSTIVNVDAGTVITNANTLFPTDDTLVVPDRNEIIGWSTEKNGTTYYTGTVTPDSNVKLYAVYNNVEVYLNFGNGSNNVKVKIYKDNSKVVAVNDGTVLNMSSHDGVDIYGWYTSPTVFTAENRVTNSAMAFDFTKIQNGDVLYARYIG